MSRLKKLIAIGTTATMLLWSSAMVLPAPMAQAATIADGDLVKSADSSAVYYIQGANKRVFPHYNVYLSWGYPGDFSTVKTVSASELAAYTDDNSMPFRDGSLFRGTAVGLGGLEATAVYYVEGSELRPVLSEQVYQGLFNDTNWVRVTWVPDDLLTKFNYDMGADLTTSATHPNGSIVQYTGTSQKYLIEGGQKRAISDAAFSANRYLATSVITIDTDEVYANGSSITGVESGLLTPGWVATTVATTSALTASLYNTPSISTIPDKATNVAVLRLKLTAGNTAATVDGLTFKRTDLGATTDWETLYVYEGTTCLTPTGRSLNTDDHTVEFTALDLSIGANASKTIELRGDLATAGATANSRHAFQLTALDTSATVTGLPVTGNVMTVGSVEVTTAVLSDGIAPINPSVGAQGVEIASFKIQANGSNDLTFSQAVFTFTGTMSRNDITNINLYLLGETTSLASVASIDSNDTFTITLNSPYVITKGQTKNFLLKANLAGEVGRTMKVYIEETYHLAVSDNQYNYGAAVTNGFDTGDATELTLEGGEVTMTDNGPIADEIAQNQQDVILTKVAMTSERNIEVRKLYITLAEDIGAATNPTDGVSDLRIKDEDTGQTLMTTSSLGTTVAGNYLMTGTFNLSAGVTRNLIVTVDVGVDVGDVLSGKYVSADLSIVDRSDDSIATGATDEEAQMRDISTGDWVLTADIIPVSVSGENMTIQAAALTMAEASTPVSGLTVVKGASKVDGIGIVFRAGDASDINIRQFATRIYVNSAATFLAAGEISSSSVVTTAYLYDGETLLSSKTISATSATHDYGAVTFDGLDIDITAGSTKKLVIKYDVSDALSATRYVAVGVKETTVTAYDNEGDAVSVTDNDVNYYTDDTSVPDHYKILSTTGSLTMAQDSSTPDSAIVIAGTSDSVISKIKFTATNENWTINELRVIIDSDNDGVGDTTNESSIANVKIAFEDTTKTGALASGYADFTNLGWVIEKDTEEILTISADLSAIDPAINTTGRQIKLGIDEDSGFKAVGESSTTDTDLELGDVNAWGNVMYLRKSKPTVALASTGTTLNNGTVAMHSFTVAADAAGDIAVKKFSWDVQVSDYGTGGALTATTWKLYKGTTAISTSFSDGTTTSSASTTGAAIPVTGTKVLVAEIATEEVIAAGTSQTFILKAAISNAVAHDSISTTLINDDNDITAYVAGYVTNSVLELVQLHNGTTAASVDFLWSDKARGINHSSTYDQTTKKDWTDGYLIDVLPTDTVSLVFPS